MHGRSSIIEPCAHASICLLSVFSFGDDDDVDDEQCPGNKQYLSLVLYVATEKRRERNVRKE